MSKVYPKPGMVGSLFSGHHEETGWKAPTELPDFSNYGKEERFGFDTETSSKDPHTARIAGFAVCTPDRKKYYLPVGHRGGGNLDENSVRRWAKSNLEGRHLAILNAKYDVHVCYNWGLDLESIGCRLHDPAFKAALLDENRRRFNLNLLSEDLLGKSKSEPSGSKSDISDMSASEVGGYAENDAELHLELDNFQQLSIDREELGRVCDLEDQLIYSTCTMERRGARLDIPKLDRWIQEVSIAHQEAILRIYAETGMRINPNSQKDLKKLFDSLHIEYPRREEELGGDVTFEDEYISRIIHPTVRLAIAAKKLDSLNSKYLRKYRKLLDSRDILRYSLHQLRNDEYGTVTGRYASANVNIQQVMKVESQLEEAEIAAWIVRELFIPADGAHYISADASQIEFRWFAHYSKSARLINDYVQNPGMDFHILVANLVNQPRHKAKHLNFGNLYTMGVPKLARKLGLSCNCGCDSSYQWDSRTHREDCRIHAAFAIAKEYDQRFPEAKALTKEAMRVAKIRGYVKTIMGRRGRFPNGERLHTALNKICQGSAADTLKVKILESYNNRKFLTLDHRACVHDEIDGDIWEPARSTYFKELLEAPDSRIPCRVPLLWDVAVGKNWRETTE